MTVRIFVDADNTLWDTDSIYASAQLYLARAIASLCGGDVATDDVTLLRDLRAIDQRLAHESPEGLAYPPILLAQQLHMAFGGDGLSELADVVESYHERLKARPELRAGVAEAIPQLVSEFGLLTIVTESRKERCESLVAHHGLTDFFLQVVCDKKTPKLYRSLRSPYFDDVMVGDQIDKDVLYPQAAGFHGVLFRSAFSPFWAEGLDATPHFEIADFREMLAVVRAIRAGNHNVLA